MARRRRQVLALAALLLLATLALSEWPQQCRAVDVGDSDSCPSVTTVYAVDDNSTSSNTTTTSSSNSLPSVKITTVTVETGVGYVCSSTVVKATKDKNGVVTLDLSDRAIVIVDSLPSADIVRLDNNQIVEFTVDSSIKQMNMSNNTMNSLFGYEFPDSMTILDLSYNLFESFDSTLLPSSLTHLNLTGNNMGGLINESFPSGLIQLEMANAGITSLQNFSFPNAITTLDLTDNPIETIKGVLFPASLTDFTLITADPSSTSITNTYGARVLYPNAKGMDTTEETTLEEFEVCLTDAEKFAAIKTFDVSTTSTLVCSDSNADPRYVDDTMLCVLSDAEFTAKYGIEVLAAVTSTGSGVTQTITNDTSQSAELELLEETMHQRRTWFLISSAGLLSVSAVVMCIVAFCACLRRPRQTSEVPESRAKRLELSKAASRRRLWPENPKMLENEEVRRLLSSDTSTTEDEASVPTVFEQEDADHTITTAPKGTPLGHLQHELQHYEIAAALIKHKEVLHSRSHGQDEADEAEDSSSSIFVYSKGTYRRKTVVLKTLQTSTQRKSNRSKHGSDSKAEMWSFVEEIRLCSTLSHPQVVTFYGYMDTRRTESNADDGDDDLALVMEYMSKGDLNTFIQKHKRYLQFNQAQRPRRASTNDSIKAFVRRVVWHDMEDQAALIDEGSDDDSTLSHTDGGGGTATTSSMWSWRNSSTAYKSKISIAIEVAEAVKYLHSFSPPLFHGNLSSRKVFMDNQWNVKLGDLTCCSALRRWSSSHKQNAPGAASRDFSRVSFSSSDAASSSDAGDEIHLDMTVWTAPEVLDGRQYTEKADVYSLGILLTQLETYECSAADRSVMDDTEVPMLHSGYPRSQSADGDAPTLVRLLMLKCQAFQPEDRPTADEMVRELRRIEQEMLESSSSMCTTPVA